MGPEPYAWSWNVEALVVVPLLAAGYVWLVRRYPAEPWRVAAYAASLLLILAVTVTPVETLSIHYLLSVHLLQNVVLAEWAPLAFALGIPAAFAARLPRVPAIPALLLWAGNYMVWHLPWIYDAALRNPHTLLHLEHAMYFATGVLLWWPVVHDRLLGAGTKAAYVFGAFALASPIGLLLALVPEPIYQFYVDAPRRVWGLDPLRDQQIAGVAMSLAETVVFFAVFVVFFVRFLAEQDAEPAEGEPGAAA
ncbi:MAG TPA: cytochrome c oxidase assembly protein [Gaiellaceae bacterium]|nr:cytochrome c oxidase assembly protein [Gaiellaceae bacterium]